MKLTLLTVVTFAAVATLASAADPECVYRKLRGLAPHWPNPTSCASYYRCSNKNTVRSLKCPAGKEYNSKSGKCSTARRGLCKLSLAAPLAEPSNVCSSEVSGAYLSKTGYCGEFFICDDQVAYPQVCDAGSMFDITTNGCVPDTESVCWQNFCLTKTTGEVIASETSCLNYYVCEDGQTTQKTCASGTYFDDSVASCVVDENNSHCWENFCVGKADGSAVADADKCTIFYVCYNQMATSQECPTGSYFEESGPHCVPGTCPSDDSSTSTTTASPSDCGCSDGSSSGEMVPNPDNCRMYFTCVNGELIPGDCLQGNYFDGELGNCAVDSSGCCPDSSSTDCVDGTLTDDANNCNQYFVCQDGNWESKTCPSGSYFDTQLRICLVDENNVCPQCDTGATDSSSTTETVPIITTETPPAIDGNPCSGVEAAVAGADCWNYLACIAGKWIQESCTGGYYFDASVGICRPDDDNQCPENKLLEPNARTRRAAENDCNCPDGMDEGSMVPHPTECAMYQICVNGQLIDGSCGQGNIFSSCENICVPDTEATCWVCNNKPNGYQMINPSDCTAYSTCIDGVSVPSSCPSGEWFDGDACAIDVTGKCINPCSCGSGNVANPICSKYYKCTDGVPQVVNCGPGAGFNSAIGKCSSNVTCEANQCATAADRTAIAIAGDVTRFYLCVNNIATIRSCLPNTEFSPTFLVCLATPSTSCDQSQCKKANVNQVYPSLTCDNTTFCLCQSDGAYLNNCPSGLSFDAALGACTFTGPCDPEVCVDTPEYSVSVNYDDPNSFCLCRAGEPTPVPCPRGYTFNSELELCVLIPIPDPRCCSTYCVNQPNFVTFPALDTDTGFCMCTDEVPSFKQCLNNMIFDATLGICLVPAEPTTCPCNECDSTQCVSGPDNLVFPSNTPAGFCLCKDFCGVYTPCLLEFEFDPDLLICLEPAGPSVCDASQCDVLAENEAYAANNGTDGFCYCQEGLPNYSPCLDNKQFDAVLGICLEPVNGCMASYCDSEQCSCLGEYQTFPSSNEADDTSFCVCEGGEAIYENCLSGKYYNAGERVCMIREAPCSVCTPGQCATMKDNSNFAALNTTSGFCLCLEGVATYLECLDNKQYDATLGICLPKAKAATTEDLLCDVAQCQNRAAIGVTTFAAKDSANGFCTCQADGSASFESCGEYKIYDQTLNICVTHACDPELCKTLKKFESFAARNTTNGFCSCDTVPTFYQCPVGREFNSALGLCVDVVTGVCDPQECAGRTTITVFAAQNTFEGFCLCDGSVEGATYHSCQKDYLYDPTLQLCALNDHGIQKRSVEPEEKVRSVSFLKKLFQKLA
ncbi:GH17131 [Drosophila grimshawi]|uniref:GH17131 n=1 Tax=Drosophila grimshawi TaxID=7222 RepID=B4J0P7_DROGR|nr:GH17131 [Drosophila grimshawi]